MPPLAREQVVARLRRAGCVFAEEETDLIIATAGTDAEQERLVARRETGEPLETLLGWVDFGGVRVLLDPGVFVPRQRSRFLVELALARCGPGALVVDLCCGAGAVGAALLAARPDLDLWAGDVDPVAVACARRNLPPERVREGDLLSALPGRLRGRVRVIVANAPYVPTDQLDFMPREARAYEPVIALDGGPDGTAVHARIAAQAEDWLVPDGVVIMETSVGQASVTAGHLESRGFGVTRHHSDALDATAVVGIRRSVDEGGVRPRLSPLVP